MSIEGRKSLKSNPISFPEILRHQKDRFLQDKHKLENLSVRRKLKTLHRSNASQLSSGRRFKTEVSETQNPNLSHNLSVALRPPGSPSIWTDPNNQQNQQMSFLMGISDADNPEKKTKSLIKRLRKLRQYNQGHFFMARKKQEQQRKISQQKKERQRSQRLKKYKLYKQQQSRKNIIMHQSRIEQRKIQLQKQAARQQYNRSIFAPPFQHPSSQQLSLNQLQKRLQRISVRLNKRFP